MNKREKVLLIIALFLTVVATSAITTVIISPTRATAYSSDPLQNLSNRVSFIEEDMMFVHKRIDRLEETDGTVYSIMERTGIMKKWYEALAGQKKK